MYSEKGIDTLSSGSSMAAISWPGVELAMLSPSKGMVQMAINFGMMKAITDMKTTMAASIARKV